MRYNNGEDPELNEKLRLHSMTQHFDPPIVAEHLAEEADINVLVERFAGPGWVPPPVPLGAVQDLGEAPRDLQDALERVRDAQELFRGLPPDWRERFHNNPLEFYQHCADPSNHEELLNAGVLTDGQTHQVRVEARRLAEAQRKEEERLAYEQRRQEFLRWQAETGRKQE